MTDQAPDDLYRVDATADKALFVSMLVKDIELLPAIIDLVDNSVDSARATSPGDLSKNEVVIDANGSEFSISDNCGGINLSVARKYAFRFGRPSEYEGIPGSVGQFGIGMKRALFKLGHKFSVESRSGTTSFELNVDVREWLADTEPDWQFRMANVDESYDSSANGTGTAIRVTELQANVAEDLSSPIILAQLREQIRMRHQAVLQEGLKITLNGEQLTGFAPMLLSGPEFSPINRRFVITAEDGGDVHCHIVAGVSASEGDESRDEGDAEDFRRPGSAGWWLFCNGRLLFAAERSALTGWGDNVAAYHPQFRRFRGYVYLTSLDASLLPWNTTKTGVDQDSRIWRTVQSHMKVALGQVVAVLNRMKLERQQGESPEDTPVTVAAAAAQPTPLSRLRPSNAIVVPRPPSARTPKRNTQQRIQYDVDVSKYQGVAEVLEVSVVAEVGRRTFDYFYEREVEG